MTDDSHSSPADASRVLILYNEPVLAADHPDADSEHEIHYTVEHVQAALVEAGYRVDLLAVSRDPQVLLTGLRRHKPDVVFNLFEGLADHYETEAHVAGLLEWLGVPFTGSPSQTLSVARTKHVAKRLLRGAGLPTPEFAVVETAPAPECPLEWPVIVKPAAQDASVGLDQGSVVTNQHALNERVAQLIDAYGPPVLVEQFIRGREINVGVVEAPDLRVLPPSEILFESEDSAFWPIVTYDAKWKPGTPDYEVTPPLYPTKVAPRLLTKLNDLAEKAFRLLGCRDYARIDFRVRPGGKPYILEVNPNPDFSPMAGMAGCLGPVGITHAAFTVQLMEAALRRGRKGPFDALVESRTDR
jgi:D-alanine-D-alanine ligase